MSETAIGDLTARDLGPEHYGRLVVWEEPTDHGTVRREVVFDELRRWVFRGVERVEIVDMTSLTSTHAGVAYHPPGGALFGIGRRIVKARKRRWSKIPLLTWEQAHAEAKS